MALEWVMAAVADGSWKQILDRQSSGETLKRWQGHGG
jgi:hypothetical protein